MSKQIRRKYKLVIVLAAIVVAGLALIRPLTWRSMAADLSYMAVDFDELVRDETSLCISRTWIRCGRMWGMGRF